MYLPLKNKVKSSEQVSEVQYFPIASFNLEVNRQLQVGQFDRGAGFEFMSYFQPLSFQCFNHLVSKFSAQINSEKDLAEYSQVLLRDGEFGVKDFFDKFPAPPNSQTELLISFLYKNLIPKKWVGQVKTYEILCRKSKSKKTGSSFIFESKKGLVFCGQPTKQISDLIQIIDRYKSTISDVRVCVFEMFKNSKGETLGKGDPIIRLVEKTFKNISYLNEQEFFVTGSLLGFRFVDLSSDRWIYDSFLKHFILSRGGVLEGVRMASKDEVTIHLSPYHGLKIK